MDTLSSSQANSPGVPPITPIHQRAETPAELNRLSVIDKMVDGTANQVFTFDTADRKTSSSSIQERNRLTPEKIERLNQYIDKEIKKYEGWKETALQTALVALAAIGISIAITAIFYASPIIPFGFVLFIPLIFILYLTLSGAGPPGGPAVGPDPGKLWTGLFELSITGGVKWAQLIYTAKVAIAVGIANAAVVAVALPIAAAGGITAWAAGRKVQEFQELKALVDHLKQEPERFDSLAKKQMEQLQTLISRSER